jgi:hypothetical protein
MGKQQTAVEYLVHVVQCCIAPNYIPIEIVKQAKEMEKEQIEDAFQEGKWNGWEWSKGKEKLKDPTEYYNEIYSE